MKKCIIVDIDGTLSNCDHRQPFLRQKPKDWKSFHERCHLDEPHLWCIDLLKKYMNTHTIILVSGRVDESRVATFEWLILYGVPYHWLYMRGPGDHRDDTIFKKEIYERNIKGKFKVDFVLDDRRRLADMWRAEGLVVLHCAEGNF